MTLLTSTVLVTLVGKKRKGHPGNLNGENASIVKYSNKKKQSISQQIHLRLQGEGSWSAETDLHCFPKQKNNKNK